MGTCLLSGGRIYDDTSIAMPTLGQRRLQMEVKSKLSIVAHNILQLIKVAKGQKTWFLDRYGKVYCYIKTRNEHLKTHQILEVRMMGTYSILIVDGVDFPILVERPPPNRYARILYIEKYPWKIYDYVDEYRKPSTKKV